MTEKEFWTLIGEVEIAYEEDEVKRTRVLEIAELLSVKSIKSIIAFNNLFDEKIQELRAVELDLREVADNQYMGYSDDGFEYFLMWIVSRGKTFFEDSLARQQKLFEFLKSSRKIFGPEFEAMAGIWYDAYDMKKERFEKNGDTEVAEDRMLMLLHDDKDIYEIEQLLTKQ